MDAAHHCPRCGGAHAERRTARNYRERAALALLGYHPYRCLDCGHRFLDRPLARPAARKVKRPRAGGVAPSAAEKVVTVTALPARPPAPTLAITRDHTGGA